MLNTIGNLADQERTYLPENAWDGLKILLTILFSERLKCGTYLNDSEVGQKHSIDSDDLTEFVFSLGWPGHVLKLLSQPTRQVLVFWFFSFVCLYTHIRCHWKTKVCLDTAFTPFVTDSSIVCQFAIFVQAYRAYGGPGHVWKLPSQPLRQVLNFSLSCLCARM